MAYFKKTAQCRCSLTHFICFSVRWRGSRAAPAVPSEGGTKSSRSSLTFISVCVSHLFYHSLLPTAFFCQSKRLSHSLSHQHRHTLFVLVLLLVFCLFNLYLYVSCSPARIPLLSLSVLFSTSLCSTCLHPRPCVRLAFYLILSLYLFFVIPLSLTTGTEIVLEAQLTQGGYSPVVHVKAAVFPFSSSVSSHPGLSLPVLASCCTHSTAATMSSRPASPLSSIAHPTKGFSGLP